ncbi:MAG: riboflavin synthase [Microbacteriaceae bacterium]
MFTGLIEEIGVVTAVEPLGDGSRFTIRGAQVSSDAKHGDSISVSGVCLTVIDRGVDSFSADVMQQTILMSKISSLVVGSSVNLERAAELGSRLGGHIVQGHIDGTAAVLDVRPGEAWRVIRIELPNDLAPLVVDKGSITVDGVSLTVSAIGEDAQSEQKRHWFEISLIPETLVATTLGEISVGDRVNLESDIVARHVQRLMQFTIPTTSNTSQGGH